MNANDVDSYWDPLSESAPTSSAPACRIHAIDGVVPLDVQFGVGKPKVVPDALREPLFGQLNATPLHTYAILDAGKIPNLPELLDTSGLAHRCLFKGDAFDTLKNVAPWIVQLEKDATFTRNLFTQSDAPWHVWDTEPGIYVRSAADFDAVWQHFRKFTMVQNEDGKWFYFRFWEPDGFTESVAHANVAGMFRSGEDLTIAAAYAPTQRRTFAVIPTDKADDGSTRFILNANHRAVLDQRIETRFTENFATTLQKAAPHHLAMLGVTDHGAVASLVATIVGYVKPLGFTKGSDIAKLASCAVFYGTFFLSDPRVTQVSQHHLRDGTGEPSLKAKRFEEALHKILPLPVVTQTTGLTHILPHLRTVFETPELTQNWLARVYTPAVGFMSPEIARQFVAACHDQQALHAITDPMSQNAHYVLAAIYTPYFLDDPLHRTLLAIFAQQHGIEQSLIAEIMRRIAELKEA